MRGSNFQSARDISRSSFQSRRLSIVNRPRRSQSSSASHPQRSRNLLCHQHASSEESSVTLRRNGARFRALNRWEHTKFSTRQKKVLSFQNKQTREIHVQSSTNPPCADAACKEFLSVTLWKCFFFLSHFSRTRISLSPSENCWHENARVAF